MNRYYNLKWKLRFDMAADGRPPPWDFSFGEAVLRYQWGIESEEILKILKKEPQKKHEKCDLLGDFWENMV